MSDVVIFIIFIIGTLLLIAFSLYLAVLLDQASCQKKSVSFSDSEYTIIGGCMVEHKGKWLPLENIRGFD